MGADCYMARPKKDVMMGRTQYEEFMSFLFKLSSQDDVIMPNMSPSEFNFRVTISPKIFNKIFKDAVPPQYVTKEMGCRNNYFTISYKADPSSPIPNDLAVIFIEIDPNASGCHITPISRFRGVQYGITGDPLARAEIFETAVMRHRRKTGYDTKHILGAYRPA